MDVDERIARTQSQQSGIKQRELPDWVSVQTDS